MKSRDASLLAVGTALAVIGNPSWPSEESAHVPQIEAARSAPALISRADRALRRYLDACGSNRRVLDVVTNDARIEYTLENPGALLSLDASSVFASCASIGASGMKPANLWIYPTGDDNAVFVQYDAPSPGERAPMQQVAVIEMRGERIHRMRNFGAPPEVLLSNVHGQAQSELCARLSWDGERLATNTAVGLWQPLRGASSVSVTSP